jgi:hypothetical protein
VLRFVLMAARTAGSGPSPKGVIDVGSLRHR